MTDKAPNQSDDCLTVTLRPVGPGPDAAARFKRALKYLGRVCGLRAYWPDPDRDGRGGRQKKGGNREEA